MMARELLLAVTDKDCVFTYARGSGKGGQKRNKTSTAARCRHKESGAIGFSDDTRSQHKNKRLAFQKMAQTQKFCQWHTGQIAEKMGVCPANEIRVEIGA